MQTLYQFHGNFCVGSVLLSWEPSDLHILLISKKIDCRHPSSAMGEKIHMGNIVIPNNETPSIKDKTPYNKNDNDAKQCITYKTVKKSVYFLLERPSDRVAVVYHFVLLMLILGSLVVSVLATIEEMEHELEKVIFYYEMFLLFWFSVEFIARMWSCSYISRYQGSRGRLRFFLSVYMLIDVCVILSTITTFAMRINGSYFAILRVTRFMQVFRILRIDRQRGDFKTMGKVVKEHGKELITVYFVGFVIMFSATYIVYLVEKHTEFMGAGDPDPTQTPANLGPAPSADAAKNTTSSTQTSEVTINNMANGLYWAVITVTSVGYGDFSPTTWTGKICCAIFALIGCAFFSLPAGILGSGFALQVAKQKKEKRFVKVRNPAAYLIQTMWRNYALRQERNNYEATWYYLLPMLCDSADFSSSTQQQTLDQLIRNEIEKGTLDLGEMFPPIFSPERSRAHRSFYAQQKVNSSPQMESAPLLNNNNLLEGRVKRLGRIINRSGSDGISSGKTIILSKDKLLKKGIHPSDNDDDDHHLKPSLFSNGCETKLSMRHGSVDGDGTYTTDDKNEKIHQQIHTRYKIALRFVMKMRYWTAIKIFKSVRHPFVNMQDIMEKNALGHVEMLAHIKNMRDSFNVLHRELIELRYSLVELKEEKETAALQQRHPRSEEYEKERPYLKRSHSFTAGVL